MRLFSSRSSLSSILSTIDEMSAISETQLLQRNWKLTESSHLGVVSVEADRELMEEVVDEVCEFVRLSCW